MFTKMTISTKVSVGFVIMLVMIAILALASRYTLTQSESRFINLIQHEARLIEQVGYARLTFLEVRKLEGMLIYEPDASLVKDAKNGLSDLSDRLDSIQVIADNIAFASLIQLSSDVISDFKAYSAKFDEMAATPVGRKRMLAVAQVRKSASKLEESLSALNLATKSRMTKETMVTKAGIAQLDHAMLVMIALIMSFGLAMVFLIPRSIKHALAVMTDTIRHVQRTSDFSHRAIYHNQDEVGASIQALNQLLASLEQAIAEANQVVGAIAQADFSQRMQGNYVGELDTLKQGVNASAVSVAFMMGELEKVMNSLNQGQFDVRMEQKVPKAFRDLVEVALNSIQLVFDDMNQVADKMKAGNFDARVTADARGHLLEIKESFNESMEHTARVIRSIVGVVEAQALGDLTKTLPSGTYLGQFHELKNAMAYSAERVKDSIVQVIEASNIVHDAATQVSQGSADLSGRVQEQAAALEETSATMNEMSSAVQTNTANAKKVADLAYQVQHQASAGVEVMQKTITAMQSIQESSNKIADIVSIIDSIAFQTNLLALNAAVEAARAGEHGRGFAVVAGEVRALAQKSASAAKDIKDLINDSVARIEAGTHLADKSGEMLTGITDSIAGVATMVEQIATASAEQSQGIEQVHRAIANIDRVTQENAALVEETSAAAESLDVEANRLKDNMSFFTVGVVQVRAVSMPVVNATKPKREGVAKLPSPKPSNQQVDQDEWRNF